MGDAAGGQDEGGNNDHLVSGDAEQRDIWVFQNLCIGLSCDGLIQQHEGGHHDDPVRNLQGITSTVTLLLLNLVVSSAMPFGRPMGQRTKLLIGMFTADPLRHERL
jgi:hypothetical protein